MFSILSLVLSLIFSNRLCIAHDVELDLRLDLGLILDVGLVLDRVRRLALDVAPGLVLGLDRFLGLALAVVCLPRPRS